MPLANGKLFLPVKKEIRKKIGKQKGDRVHIVLYADKDPTEIPEELLLCLLDNPKAHATFLRYTDSQQKMFIDWIFSAKTDQTKVNRITRAIEHLEKGKKFGDKE